MASRLDNVHRFPLITALLNRRSRRVAHGATLNGGGLAYQSQEAPTPLTEAEQALLAFAACGITGTTFGDLPFQSGSQPEAGHGNILMHLVGRTVASGDASHAITMFVMDDNGAYLLRRPQQIPATELAELMDATYRQEWVELYRRNRIKIADHRLEVPREIPFTLPFNKWSGNLLGTTTFLPVAELTALALNALITGFEEDVGYFLLDDRNNYQPAGLAKFGKSRGGHLYDDPAAGRTATISIAEGWLYEFCAIEMGGMLQNLALMVEALGLGGFAYFAAHPYGWLQQLGFRMVNLPFSHTAGLNPLLTQALNWLGRNLPVPTAVGLEHGGEVLIKPFAPPYYRTMEEAVLAFVEYKFAPQTGTLRHPTVHAWRDAAKIQATIPRPSDKAIAATIAYCDYAYKRYGRFPPNAGAFRTVLAYQAHHFDSGFYQTFY